MAPRWLHARAGCCLSCHVSLVDHKGGVCPPEVFQAPHIADSLLHMYHRAQCILPTVYNPSGVLRALDSTEGGVGDS